MSLRIEKIEPDINSVNPTFKIDTTFRFENMSSKIIPLQVFGELQAENGKVLTNLIPIYGPNYDFSLEARDYMFRRDPSALEFPVTFIGTISKVGLDYIQEKREKNEYNDIVIYLKAQVRFLESKTALSHLKFKNDEAEVKEIIFEHSEKEFHSSYTNLWILSGEGGREFLKLRDQSFEVKDKISSSDWVQKFAPVFKIGRVMLIEMPLTEALDENINEKIKLCHEGLNDILELVRKAEWVQVMKKSRELFEILNNKKLIKLAYSKSHSSEAIDSFHIAMKALFDYSSKFVHVLTRGKEIKDEEIPNKEDAYFVYFMLSASLNSFTSKLSRDSK